MSTLKIALRHMQTRFTITLISIGIVSLTCGIYYAQKKQEIVSPSSVAADQSSKNEEPVANTYPELDTHSFSDMTTEERILFSKELSGGFLAARRSYRKSSGSDEEYARNLAKLRTRLRSNVEVQFLVDILAFELQRDNRDWVAIHRAFLASSAGVHDERVFEFAKQVILEEKPISLSDEHSQAMLGAINVLAFLDVEGCSDLLLKCTEQEYWEEQQFTTRIWGGRTVLTLRKAVIHAIAKLERQLSISTLQFLINRINKEAKEDNASKEDLSIREHTKKILDKLLELPNEEYSRYYEDRH